MQYHWYESVPDAVAVTENVCELPRTTVASVGCSEMDKELPSPGMVVVVVVPVGTVVVVGGDVVVVVVVVGGVVVVVVPPDGMTATVTVAVEV